MDRFLRRLTVPLLMLAFHLTLASAVMGQAPPPPMDSKAIDDSLRSIINTGAELFNKKGDYVGCFRLFQGSLISVRPWLSGDLQKEIDKSLASAEKLEKFEDRAFELRRCLDLIRKDLKNSPLAEAKKLPEEKKVEPEEKKVIVEEKKPEEKKVIPEEKKPEEKKVEPEEKKPEEKKVIVEEKKPEEKKVIPEEKKPEEKKVEPEEKKPEEKKIEEARLPEKEKKLLPLNPITLWDRLGGEAKVGVIVGDFIKSASADPDVNLSRGGKFKLDDKDGEALKKLLIESVSHISGGPRKQDLKKASQGLGITDAEYAASAKHLEKALVDNGITKDDVESILKTVNELKKEIVEPVPPLPVPPLPLPPEVKKEDPIVPPPVRGSKVDGKVTFEGQPLPEGKTTIDYKDQPKPIGYLTLVSEEGRRMSTAIKTDGSFAFKSPILPGTYKGVIENAPEQIIPEEEDIPARYRSLEATDLSIRVAPGNQSLEIKLVK